MHIHIQRYICKYFGISLMPMDEQISARQGKFYLSTSESAVCHAISKLK